MSNEKQKEPEVVFLDDEQFVERQTQTAATEAYLAEARARIEKGEDLDKIIEELDQAIEDAKKYGEIIPEEEAGFEVAEENSSEA